MEKILVPTDFSPEANNAVEVACQIASKIGAELHLLHVIEPVGSSGGVSIGGAATEDSLEQIFVIKLMEQTKKRMHELAESIRCRDIQVIDDVLVESIYSAIRDYSDENGISLIVMGSKGASGAEEFFVGSNTEKVVRKSHVPVLTIKNQISSFSVSNIAFATNCEDNVGDMIATIKKFQELFGAKLHLVNISTPGDFYHTKSMRKRMDEFAQAHGISNYTINVYNESSEEDGIIHFADEINADLIAMGTHGRTGLLRLLSGSIAEDIVNHATRPVLTLHLKNPSHK